MCPNLAIKLKEKLSNLINRRVDDNFIECSTKDKAIKIAKKLCEPNEKGTIVSGLLNKLLAFENRINKGRDHVNHTEHTYLLGMIIIDALEDESINKFTWKIASLFHDIGYEHAELFSTDHGLVGAIITWDMLYSQYLKENPNEEDECIITRQKNQIDYSWSNLEKHILPACKAILLHNKPENYRKKKLSYSDNKYAYLLIICDTLQIWSRPQNCATPSSYSSSPKSYSINCYTNNDHREFLIDFSIDDNIKNFEDELKNIEDELKKKCNCEVDINSNTLKMSWKY